MTTIRKIVTSKVDGDDANNTSLSEVRSFGETSFYLDTDTQPNKLTLMIFDGLRTHLKSKVLSPGVLYGSNADSGDGLNRDTIKLIPDAELHYNYGDYGNDQFLIIDPTAPNHIHIRAGGTIDQSNADLFLGGDRNHVRVSDSYDNVIITTDAGEGTRNWSFDNSGNLTFPDTTVQTTAWTGILPSPTYSGSDQIGLATPAPLNLNNSAAATLLTQLNLINTGGEAGAGSAIDFWTYTSINNVPEVRLQAVDDGDFSADFAIKIKANGNSGNGSLTTSWTFGADGTLTFPGGMAIETTYGGSPRLVIDGKDNMVDIRSSSNILIGFNNSSGNVFIGDQNSGQVDIVGPRFRVFAEAPTSSTGKDGDQAGQVAFDDSYIYHCIAGYNQTGHQVTGSDYLGRPALNTNSFQLTKTADTPQIAAGDIISDSDGGETSIVDAVTSDADYTYVLTGATTYNCVFPLTFTSADYVAGGNIWKRVAWSADTW